MIEMFNAACRLLCSYVTELAFHIYSTAPSVSSMQFGLIQYVRLVGTNFSKNSCNRAFASENETWSLELVVALDIVLLFFAPDYK
jgi:hypothetical protein